MNWENLPQLLDLRTTAGLLGVHANTLRQWDRSGRLKAIRLGQRRDRRYDKQTVQRLWLERGFDHTDHRQSPIFWTPRTVVATVLVVAAILVPTWTMAGAGTQPTETIWSIMTCQGWTAPADHSGLATFSSKQNQVRTGSGVVTGTLNDAANLLCDGPKIPTKVLTNADRANLEVQATFTGAVNTTDAIVLEMSLNGKKWTTLKVISVANPPSSPLTVALPATVLGGAGHLQIRLRPDLEPQSGSTRVSVKSMAVHLTSNVTAANVLPGQNSSAAGELDRLIAFSKQAYRQNEQPVVTVPKHEVKHFLLIPTQVEDWVIRKIDLVDSSGKSVEAKFNQADQRNGQNIDSLVTIDTRQLHPGRYSARLTLRDQQGRQATIIRPFLWGVVALNPTPTVVRPGVAQNISIGILDDTGHTYCQANIQVTIVSPSGVRKVFRTRDASIITNPDCIDKGVTKDPDYTLVWTPKEAGTFHVSMAADTPNGQRLYEDNLVVDKTISFDVHRIQYPTRIYPLAPYPVRLSVTPRVDFSGSVRETVPANFVITNVSPTGTIRSSADNPNLNTIEWLVDWHKGETYFLSYTFDAPDVSPDLFLTGPLTIGGSFTSSPVFQEPRQWQIASDEAVVKKAADVSYTPIPETDGDWNSTQPTILGTPKPIYQANETVPIKVWDKGFALNDSPSTILSVKNVRVESPAAGTFPFDQAVQTLNKNKLERQVVYLVPNDRFRPGRYTVIADVNDGQVTRQERLTFDWGLLSITTQAAKIKQSVKLNLTSSSPQGLVSCDESLTLTIESPDGKTTTMTAQDGTISLPDDCTNADARRAQPTAVFLPTIPGVYHLKLTRTIDGQERYVMSDVTVGDRPETPKKIKEDINDAVKAPTHDFKTDEQPSVQVVTSQKNGLGQTTTRKVTGASLVDPKGSVSVVDLPEKDQTSGSTTTGTFTVPSSQLHRPGKYTLNVIVEQDGYAEQTQQDFTWGVLAVNLRRSIERPKTATQIGVAVLNDEGRTICDAGVEVTVTDPSGVVTHLTTDDKSVARNPDCIDHGFTNDFDYAGKYTTTDPGTYKLHVTAHTFNGDRSIDDSFQVQDKVDFDIERTNFSMRIWPNPDYPQNFTITANQDYSGIVTETVPQSFGIHDISDNGTVHDEGARKVINWNVNWIAGQKYTLGYTITFPRISPEYYQLGPLTIGEFAESRQWQVASDGTCSITTGTGLNWSTAGWTGCTGGGYPGQNASGDAVSISNAVTITLNVSPANSINGLTLTQGASVTTLTFGAGNTLTNTGTTTIAASAPTANITLDVAGGTYNANGAVSLFGGTSGTRLAKINVGNAGQAAGTLTLGNGITCAGTAADAQIAYTAPSSGTNLINVTAGNFGFGGAVVCTPTGTPAATTKVKMSGSSTQTMVNSTSYPAVEIATTGGAAAQNATTAAAITFNSLTVTSGTFTKVGATSVNMTVTNATSITGTFNTATAATGSLTFTGAVTVNDPGVLDLSGQNPAVAFSSATITNNSTTAGSFKTGTGTLTLNANPIFAGSGSGGMTFGQSITIASASTYTNNMTNGTVQFASGTISSPTSANNLTLATGSNTIFTGNVTFSANATANAETVTMNGTANLTINGNLDMSTNVPSSTGNNIINCNSGSGTFWVKGTVGVKGNSTSTGKTSLTMSSCTFTADGLVTLTGGTNATGVAELTGSTGTMNINAGLSEVAGGTITNAKLTTSNSETINFVGTWTGAGTLSLNSATLTKFTGNSTALNAAFGASTWAQWEVVSGTTTLGATQTVTGLQVDSGATLAGSTFKLTNSCTGTGTAGFNIDGTFSGTGGIDLTGAGCTIDGHAGAHLVSNTGDGGRGSAGGDQCWVTSSLRPCSTTG